MVSPGYIWVLERERPVILVNAGSWAAAWTACVEWLIEEGVHRGFLFGADPTTDPQFGPLLAFLR